MKNEALKSMVEKGLAEITQKRLIYEADEYNK